MLFETESDILRIIDQLSGIESVAIPIDSMDSDQELGILMDSSVEQCAKVLRAGDTLTKPHLQAFYANLYGIAVMVTRRSDKIPSCGEFCRMLLGKHHRYGDKGLIRWGHAGMVMRIGSKVDRYTNLVGNPGLDTDATESVYDTLIDVVGYCVLGVAMLNKGF